MLIESWYKDSRGDLQSTGIGECDNVQWLVDHFRASDTLVVSSVWHDGDGTVFVCRSDKVSGVFMESSEIACCSEQEGTLVARTLYRLSGGVSHQVHDTSWVGDSLIELGTPVEIRGAHAIVGGEAYEIDDSFGRGVGQVYLKNGGRLQYTVNPGVIEGRRVKSVTGLKEFSSEVVIEVEGGTLRLGHEQQCCESISLLDFNGDAEDLVGKTVRVAEVKYGSEDETFYEIRTDGGDLWLRFGDETDDSRYGAAIEVVWDPVSP